METLTIQVTNLKAYQVLKDLEELDLIRVLDKKPDTSEKRSAKYRGKLDGHVAEEMQEYVAKGREEWNDKNT